MRQSGIFFTALIATTLFFSANGFAANMEALRHTTALQRAKVQTALMKKRLNLSQEQVPQVMKINLKYAQQMEPVIKGKGGKLVKLRESMGIGKAKENDLTKVLTPGQYQGYLASKEQMQQQMIEKVLQKRTHAD